MREPEYRHIYVNKVQFTFPITEMARAALALEKRAEVEVLLDDDTGLVEMLRGAATLIRSQMRDCIRAGHYTEEDWDQALVTMGQPEVFDEWSQFD